MYSCHDDFFRVGGITHYGDRVTNHRTPSRRFCTESRKVETRAEMEMRPGLQRPIAKPLNKANNLGPIANGKEPSNAEIYEHALLRGAPFVKPPNPFPRASYLKKRKLRTLRSKPPPDIPLPDSPTTLHKNLLYMVTAIKPPPRLPVLLDYHDEYSELQSTASYNLLVYLSMRHQSYEIARRLLDEQLARKFPKDLESYQLEVRYFIERGLWEDAWRFIQTMKDEGQLPSTSFDEKGIPLPIWLEFCRTIKRHQWRARSVYDMNGKFLKRIIEKHLEQPTHVKAHQQILKQHRPKDMPPLAHTSPYAIYCIVQLLIRSGDHKAALELTKAFFSAIPRSLKTDYIRRCLDIIHIHMHYCPAKDGLPRFYETRRTMVSLLKLHRALKPSPKTLYLLMAPLQRSKKCGTLAWKALQSAKLEWGPSVENRRVQRRVIHLALKEGRRDIVPMVLHDESDQRYFRQYQLIEEQSADLVTPKSLISRAALPLHLIYTKKGREARLWFRLRCKIHQYPFKRQGIRKFLMAGRST